MPPWLNTFYHNIFLHVAHHVDMRIPFYGLPAANKALVENFGDAIVERGYHLRDYMETTRSCKLFDFERGVWLRYGEAAPSKSVASEDTPPLPEASVL
jgi:omega-6 fatty acid desaturase (delta-12 desaturase)